MSHPTSPPSAASLALPQFLDFLEQVISGCRARAAHPHVPASVQGRLREAADHVEFFLHRRAYRRAFHEAKTATALHGAVERFLQASTDATATLCQELVGA